MDGLFSIKKILICAWEFRNMADTNVKSNIIRMSETSGLYGRVPVLLSRKNASGNTGTTVSLVQLCEYVRFLRQIRERRWQ